MKDGTTHVAYKPEHAVDLDTAVVVAAPTHPAGEGDMTTLAPTLDAAARNLEAVGLAQSEEESWVLAADKGYQCVAGAALVSMTSATGGITPSSSRKSCPRSGRADLSPARSAQQPLPSRRLRRIAGATRGCPK